VNPDDMTVSELIVPDTNLIVPEAATLAPVPTTVDKLDQLDALLNSELVERRAEIRGCITAMVGGTHVFLLGPPGVGKSWLVNRMLRYVSVPKHFDILMTRFTTPEEVFGPVSLKGLENDEFVRKIDGFLADADAAFIDEIFKANSSILNALLWAINERQYRHGNSIIKLPLSTLFTASNELPQDESLGALYDRLLFRFDVKPIRDAGNFVKMMRNGKVKNPQPLLTWEELLQCRDEAALVDVPEGVLNAIVDIRKQLAAKGIEPTDRRFMESLRAVRAAAHLDGCTQADVEHLRPLENILWERPEQQATVTEIIQKVANPLDTEATALLEQLITLESKLDSIGVGEDRYRTGTEIHGKLRRARKDLEALEQRAGGSKKRSEAVSEVKDRLKRLTQRVLNEVFEVDGDVNV
jgi:MoxR-like ATPase